MPQKTALITGITGQDGSYLAELLLEKGYRVVGMTRRTSTEVHERIEHLVDRVEIVSGDLLDQSSMTTLIGDLRPAEVYNLAAQSFVPTSWTQPVLTGEFTALGVTRILEAIRHVDPSIRFYQASSSEMFGKVQETPQREETSFYPRSPYGVAKVYGHWITVNYRESYDMFAVSGILFNHESLSSEVPVIVRRGSRVDILPIGEVFRVNEGGAAYQSRSLEGIEIWDGDGFVEVLGGSAYRHRPVVDNKGVRRIEARCGTVTTTADHVVFMSDAERAAKTVETGQVARKTALPPISETGGEISTEVAWLLGAFVGGEGLRARFAEAWASVPHGTGSYCATASGFVPSKIVGALVLAGAPSFTQWLRHACYTSAGQKRVPQIVLNGGKEIWRAFLRGYSAPDGFEAGHRTDEFEKFETNSPTLAMGLWWMASKALEQECVLSVDVGPPERPGPLYSIDLRSPREGKKSKHLQRDRQEVKRVVELPHYEGWLYDLTTTSGKFHAGVGEITVHNSPRRGKEFLTRKVADGVARIKLGISRELRLGNLEARRDWGFAGDYVRAMWLMMQHTKPEDFVIATGRTHTVREFCRLAFATAGLDYEKYVVEDPRFVRPAEVDLLIGDATKAKTVLGWSPEVSFEDLVRAMVEADLERLRPFAKT